MSDMCELQLKTLKDQKEKEKKQKKQFQKKTEDDDGGGQKNKKRKKKDIDINAPKRPSTAYIMYFQERRSIIDEKYPDLPNTEITKLVGKEWTDLPNDRKQPYLKVAQEKYSNFIKQLKEYKAKNPQLEIKIPREKDEKKQNNKPSVEKEKNFLDSDYEQHASQNQQGTKKVIQNDSSDDDDDDDDEDDIIPEIQQQFKKPQIKAVPVQISSDEDEEEVDDVQVEDDQEEDEDEDDN